MRNYLLLASICLTTTSLAQSIGNTVLATRDHDSAMQHSLNEIVISASRIPESILRSPVSIVDLRSDNAKQMGAPTIFNAVENMPEVHVITPSLGFRVLNTRGFSNTTNVRFSQLIDGIDNQAPHMGAPIANALGASDLDIEKIEIVPGTASALYGMNASNGIANIVTKNPFNSSGMSVQQLTGVNHVGNIDRMPPQVYSETNIRYAKVLNRHFAFKANLSISKGTDWVADNRTDLASTLNSSVGLTGSNNPAYDEVNGYGDESSNRRTLTLNGKKYVVARTGYRETDMDDYNLQNYKGDISLYYRPKDGNELAVSYKGALINSIYQRSNRFRLQDYTLNQYAIDYHSPIFQLRSYLTTENTGKSYNIRSLAENMDRSFKSDDKWFSDFATAFKNYETGGTSTADVLKLAKQVADEGKYLPGTAAWNAKKDQLVNINNWDYGAALRVRSYMLHAEGLLNWSKLLPATFDESGFQLLSGFDRRTYIIVPDGNYFINPVDTGKNLIYSKTGGFTQLTKDLFDKKLLLGATVRADYGEYFDWKINPRFTAVYSPDERLDFRASYQSGYRFPSIFEGFSNVVSGGVKRIGGLKVMSDGIFESSYTKASIEAFQSAVNNDVNTKGLTQAQAIAKEKSILKQNPYTYLQPEYVRSAEFGFRALTLKNTLFVDAAIYYNTYDNFIAQVEASIPKTSNADSVATYLYSASKQSKYRLWTNSRSKIYTLGGSLGLTYKYSEKFSLIGNVSHANLYKTENKDGLEDGFNTPQFIWNLSAIATNVWKHMGAGITYRHQSQYDYVSFLANGVVPAYWTMDAQCNYHFSKPDILVKFGATDLLNRPYYSMLGGSLIGGLYYVSLTYNL